MKTTWSWMPFSATRRRIRRFLAAPAHQEHGQPGHVLHQPFHGLQQDLEALHGIPAAHAPEDEVVRGEAQHVAADAALADGGVDLVDVDAVHHDDALLALEEAERHALRFLRGRHVDDGLAQARQPALEC